MKIVITGGAGFIGSHLIDRILKTTNWQIEVLDKFSYASYGLKRLKAIGAYPNDRVKLHVVDIARPLSKCLIGDIGLDVSYIVHAAAGSHVDRSIQSPRDFVHDNVLGTVEMLEYARQLPNLKKFQYFGTDEQFGPCPEGYKYKEWDRYDSRNPYSASKAAGEEFVLAWGNTYGVPIIATHCQNVIGEMQHREKFVPRAVRAALEDSEILIHTDPKTGKPGSRNYLHAQDVADAVMFLLNADIPLREKYNIANEQEISNLDVVLTVGDILGKKMNYREVNPTDVRPGFDVRYGLDGSKMAALGWQAPMGFHERADTLVKWIADPINREWLYE